MGSSTDPRSFVSLMSPDGEKPRFNNRDAPSEEFRSTSIKSAIPEILACVAATSFHFGLGITLGYSAILLPQLEAPDSDVRVTKHEAAWIASVVALAVGGGSFITGPIMDVIGRVRTVQLASVPFCIGCALISLAQDVPTLIVGRFLTGIAAIGTNPGIVYTTEVARPQLRGALVSLGPFMVSIGTLTVYTVGAFMNWRTVSWICFCSPIVPVLTTLLWSPESPSWLLHRNRIADAEKSLRSLHRNDPILLNNISEEITRILAVQRQNELSKRRGISGFLGALLFYRTGIRPLIIICVLFALQQFSGIYVVIFYAVDLFKEVYSIVDPNVAGIFVGVVRVVMSVVALFLLRHFGRRPLLMISATCLTATMITSGYFVRLIDLSLASMKGNNSLVINETVVLDEESFVQDATIPDIYRWIPMLCIMAYVACSMFGMLTIPWIMTAELFPLRIRGVAQGINIAVANVFMFLSVQTYPDIKSLLGSVYSVQWLFAAVSAVAVFFVYLFIPETHNRTLEEVENYFDTSLVYPRHERRKHSMSS